MNEEQAAFERMVKAEKGSIYSACLMFADSREEADDISQEVLINLWQGFPKFRGESNISTWVYRITLNTCISYDRKRRRRPEVRESVPEKTTDDNVLSRQSKLLHDRIRILEPFDRAIVLLWLEDMSYEEIAEIVGISSRAVGVRLVRIREKLKNQN